MTEDMIVKHCAPTLAGLKTAGLFGCRYDDWQDLVVTLRDINCRLAPKGVRVVPVAQNDHRALIYVYRPAMLARDLHDDSVRAILQEAGYPINEEPMNLSLVARCLTHLRLKLAEESRACRDDFPHEVGCFLGYPPEDVRGFILHKGACCKRCGCWKVYSDEEQAEKLFAAYKRCTEIYQRCYDDGRSLLQLTVNRPA